MFHNADYQGFDLGLLPNGRILIPNNQSNQITQNLYRHMLYKVFYGPSF